MTDTDHALGPGSHPRAAHGEIFPDVPGQLRDAGRIPVAAEDRRHHGHRVPISVLVLVAVDQRVGPGCERKTQ